jgi:hypothetical protein
VRLNALKLPLSALIRLLNGLIWRKNGVVGDAICGSTCASLVVEFMMAGLTPVDIVSQVRLITCNRQCEFAGEGD